MAYDDDPQTTAAANTAVGKQSLEINYDELFRTDDNEPTANLVVVSSAERRRRRPREKRPTTEENDSSSTVDEECSRMSNGELKSRIERLANETIPRMSRILSDKGEKLKLNLERFQGELQRRLKTQKVADECKNLTEGHQEFNGESDGLKRADQSSESPEPSFTSLLLGKMGNDAKLEPKQNSSAKPRNAFQDGMSYMSQCDMRKRNAGGKLSPSKKVKSGLRSKVFSNWKHGDDSRSRQKYGRLNGNLASRPSSQEKLPSSFTLKNGSKGLGSKSANDDKEECTVVLVDEEEPEFIEKIQEAERRYSRRNECKIFYPSREDPESLEIFRSELRCLEPGECLTSTIMNFYIRFLQELSSTSDTSKQKFYFFNTYFYSKLQEAVARQNEEAFFIKFRRWWKGVNIFEKTYIFLPVNEDKHWSLVIICVSDEEDSGPVLLHLDSLGLHCSKSIFYNVKSLLENEWKYLKEDGEAADIPIPDAMKENISERINGKTIEVPRQTNDYDCGLFVLYYIERFIEDAPEQMRKEHLSKFGKKWFKPQDASSLRRRIKTILLDEFKKAPTPTEDNSLWKPVCLPTTAKTSEVAHCGDIVNLALPDP